MDIQVPVCLEKVSIHPCKICKILYLLTFYTFKNDLPKIIDFKTHKQKNDSSQDQYLEGYIPVFCRIR